MLTRWLAFARGILRRQAIAREVDEELAFHLDQEAARLESLGVSAGEARRLAAMQLGIASVVRSDVADVRTTWVDVLWRELRVGVRALAKAPSFTVPALVVLALGIAGTTTIVSCARCRSRGLTSSCASGRGTTNGGLRSCRSLRPTSKIGGRARRSRFGWRHTNGRSRSRQATTVTSQSR
jgi:hypothetical protein